MKSSTALRSRRACGALIVLASLALAAPFGCGDFLPEAPTADDGGDASTDTGQSDGVATDGSETLDASPACDTTKPFGTPVLVANVNTNKDEDDFRLSADLLTAYFSSNRGGSVNDTYVATRSDTSADFGNVHAVGVDMAGFFTESPSLSGDGLTLFFASNRPPHAVGHKHIYAATRPNPFADFTNSAAAEVVGVNDDSDAYSDTGPFVRQDGNVLYFVSGRNGSYDLFRALKAGSSFGSLGAVTPLNKSTSNEFSPTVTPSDLVMYFASDRNSGQGYDIFRATRTSTANEFDSAKPVQELNSASDELPTFVSADDCTLYFQSARATDASIGGFDIYVATRR